MADPEHVERLKRNVNEWNKWRREHPEILPDLSGANLRHVLLRRAELSGADLRHANLNFAELNFADLDLAKLNSASLNHTDLSYTSLNHTDLRFTSFTSADLSYTSLSGADLSFANLDFVDLSFANLNDTRLNQIRFFRTFFAWVDLSQVKSLETAIHKGPSSVDINSVTLPHDEPTRLHFLRGVGFTETQIEYLPSLLISQPIQYVSLFISYAGQNEAIAKRLYTDLRKHDVPCWFAPHDLRPGTPILRGIEEAIHLHDKFLLILSKYAVNSPWIEREVDAALHQEIKRGQDVLFPIRLDNAVLESHAGWATRLQHRHIGDFTNYQDEASYQQAFTTLLRHLKVGKPPVR